MYKLAKPDGFDFYTGNTINYRDNIGKIIRVQDCDPPEEGECGRGLHSSCNPLDCFVGAKIPCSAYQVKNIDVIVQGKHKTRSQAMKIIKEITDLDRLFGFNYTEAVNPVNPFKIQPPEINDEHIKLLNDWASVRASVSVWASVWDSVRASVWDSVGVTVWDSVRDSVRASVWDSVGVTVWDSVRDSVFNTVFNSVWYSVGATVSVRASVGAYVEAYMGSLFPNIQKWKYIDHEKNVYPFQPAVDLWHMGLVPSFDGTVWRLHGGEDASVLWQVKI